jgi:hypothetical protein
LSFPCTTRKLVCFTTGKNLIYLALLLVAGAVILKQSQFVKTSLLRVLSFKLRKTIKVISLLSLWREAETEYELKARGGGGAEGSGL